MVRIIYLCPAENAPSGGIKVIYRHAELLHAMGAEAFVLHPFDLGFRCSWFDHAAPLLDTLALDASRDFVVIPEIWAGIFGPQCQAQGVRYAIFVQNGYMTHPILPGHDHALMRAAYCRADLVLTISSDTAAMIRLNYPDIDPSRLLPARYSVDARFDARPRTAAKTRLITYMPRKMAAHAARVVFALGQHLPPGWTLAPIHDVDEATCAAMLGRSSIFLAFSEFEGLPLPPLEAAVAGNLVIGYTGQGASDYWAAPQFVEVAQGDIIGFVEAARRAAERMDAGLIEPADLQLAAASLADRFSAGAEVANMEMLRARILATFADDHVVPDRLAS